MSTPPSTLDFKTLVEASAALPYAQPTGDNRIARLASRAAQVEAHASSVRPILHTRTRTLIEEFLAALRELGTPRERALYAGMDVASFVTRLLSRRPLAFLNPSDVYLLRNGSGGRGGFEAIGTEREQGALRLSELISYDEMAISALLGVSVPTHFINAGGRDNCGRRGAPGSFIERGVYVGLIGARFERAERMEWQQLLVTAGQNTAAKGYGAAAAAEQRETALRRCWARFFGRDYLPSFGEAAAHSGSARYLEVPRLGLLDVELYRQRLRASIEPFLLDADARAAAAGRRAYVHVVGLGLGVWRVHPRQEALMVETYAELLRELALPNLADLDFSWFPNSSRCGGVGDGGVFETEELAVRIHFSRRDPAARLEGESAEKLLVAMYAWDANAFPGNEYWMGSLSASGDPAAACCSNIPELQNPDLNPRVSGEFALCFDAGSPSGAPL